MKGFLRRVGWGQRAVEHAPDVIAVGGARAEGLRRWRRHLTVANAFFIAMLLVAAFALARRQGFFLASPSVEVRSQDERSVIAPEFALPGLSGSPVRLSDHQGKVILLNFWATWCPPCRAEMPSMETLYQTYRERGLVILAVSGDRAGRSLVESFVLDRGVTFPILMDGMEKSLPNTGSAACRRVTSWTAGAGFSVPTSGPGTGPARWRDRWWSGCWRSDRTDGLLR
jgi:thiol-disulfide isomerase/thioredoxin